jgi:general secretion pathway protein G
MSCRVDRRPGSVVSEPVNANESPNSARRVWVALGSGALVLVLLAYWLSIQLGSSFVLQKFAAASRGKAKADIVQLESALREYSLANGGKFPASLEALVTPDLNGFTYLKATRIPLDPWGNEYLYEPDSGGGPPTIRTLARDGRLGGDGDDADIDNLSLRRGD